MGTVATARRAGRTVRRAARDSVARFRSATEMREVLDHVLTEVDSDQRAGVLLRATGLRMRFRFPDLDTVLNLAASEDPHHHLRWSFQDPAGWQSRLDLTMDSEVANGYLQGRESLAVAIARGRVRCRGEARTALLYLPAARLLVDPYRRVIRAGYPHLSLD